MRTLITLILILGIAFCITIALDAGLKKYEKTECLEWQEQSQEYSGWYATDWQKEQCKQFDIEL